ncbi:hypothetical protein Nepgr_011982 [Nepenthes gracilis]|uniref:PHD-type domain-containing protein n=1 Tax=Nepenthes gracilis TaxID=150966 RepID=A0AAD3XMV4_NEPGR|nr:hypothetical protein Nepgr_011982 [Nepenthes gracilis]
MGEGDVCAEVLSNGEVENETSSRFELKRDLRFVVSNADLEDSPRKKQGKLEASNEDVCSEVSDPNVSPTENHNTSISHTSNGERVALDSNIQANFGELTSMSSGNSSTESSSDGVSRNDCSDGGARVSDIILEIPKHLSSTGIRKITFKFSRSKEEYESRLSTSNGLHEGESHIDSYEEGGSTNHASHNMELKMSKKVVPDGCPTNVKKLLSTGILEGAKVKYITTSREKEIPGIIKGCGYLCGCLMCNYSNVLSAYEFEQHAGGAKTRHPNNHIHLDNGRPIYSIIEELKTAPLGTLEEVVKEMAGSSFNEGSFRAWKENIQQCDRIVHADNKYQRKLPSSCQSHMSCPSKDTEDRLCPTPFERSMSSKQLTYGKQSGQGSKRVAKGSNSAVSNLLGTLRKEGGTKKRDNDLHRLLFMPNGLPDGAELAYYAKGQKILQGYKQGIGIVCGHCNCEISPSQFEAHAGWAARRQPYRHIYTTGGLSLHDIAISLANGQKITSGHSDDMCTVCGAQEGELTLCRGCPRAYHSVCLGSEYVTANDDWRCPHCCGSKPFLGDSSTNSSRPIIIRLTRVVKISENESGGCVICRAHDFSDGKFDDRTVIICDQCEKEYHVRCLRDSGLCDLKELPKDKWFCCGDCSRIHGALMELFLKGAELIPPSALAIMSRKLVEKGLSDVGQSDVQWRIISGRNRSSQHLRLLSRAAAIFRECFNPIIASSGRDLIPVMVYGRNISGQEFGNMYTVVLIVKSVVVSAGLLRIFSQEVAELPLVATSKENQGKGYFQVLFACIEGFLSSLNVENLVLPAAEEAKSIWTNKFGFRTMNQEQLSRYTRDLTLTAFNGTSWLEKALK